MIVHGHPFSLNTRKVLALLAERGARAELALVDLPKGAQHAPSHVARHPFAKAPVLEHDGFLVYESSAILRYLDRVLDGPALTPASPREAAWMDQWISVGASYFEPAAHAIAFEAIFKRVIGLGEPDRAALDASAAALGRPLDVADAWLAAHRFFAGDGFSLADLAWMPFLEYLDRLTVGSRAIARRAHLAAYWERVGARAAWTEVGRDGAQPPIGSDVAA